ncbi:hypothetical protein LCGC14_1116630 [marine sediment metagenome]|uniref:Uncharacterized protein n=1 Tax=marine sediment metagenome TaxID=412755 RepID=A0A0F9M9Z7_9ZZZZ
MPLSREQMPWYLAKLERVADVPNTAYPPGVATVTGRVALLDVREPCQCTLYEGIICVICPPYGNRFSGVHPEGKPCCNCHGLGWTPTKNAWEWLEAVSGVLGASIAWCQRDEGWELSLAIGHVGGDLEAESRWGSVIQTAFYAALKEAVTPLAINAQEAEEWVLQNIKGE